MSEELYIFKLNKLLRYRAIHLSIAQEKNSFVILKRLCYLKKYVNSPVCRKPTIYIYD